MRDTIGSTLSADFYKTLLDNMFDAVYMVNTQGIIVYWNESCTRLTGFSAEEMVGQPHSSSLFIRSADRESGTNLTGLDIALSMGMPGTWKGEICRRNGQKIPIESHISPVRDAQGHVQGAVAVFRDISAHVALEEAHQKMLTTARLDPLTQLYNRLAVSEMLNSELDRAARYHQPLSLTIVDIDYFKRFNDLYGHETGDIVLQRVAGVFLKNLRKPDIAGRWGGEEFIIVTPGSDAIDTARMAERMRQYIEELSLPQAPEPITASFGVAQYQSGQRPDQLIAQADRAMYRAKQQGRNRVVVAENKAAEPQAPPKG